ncbi:hypothetical protein [Nocardiopsis sp. LOL_012]|uniref:hypothetical protein n=1 Tax=Nocardiopsis sp. LOL_012 TaxID=3345409 RepID=UPI003A8701A6
MQGLLRRARGRVHARLTPKHTVTSDAGSASAEFVLIIMVAITIATVVGAILVQEFTTAAESIDLGVNR